METVKFINDGGTMRYVRFDGLATIRLMAAAIMSNAVRAAGGNEERYRELVQEGCVKVLEVVETHDPAKGPFVTRAAMYLAGIREDNRNEAVFEATFGIVELDAPKFETDDDQSEWSGMGGDEPWDAAEAFDVADPDQEVPEEGRVVMFAGMEIPDGIDEQYVMFDAMHPTVFLAMVLDYLLDGMGARLEAIANALGPVEHDLPAPKWDPDSTFAEFSGDEDSVDVSGVEDDHDPLKTYIMDNDEPFEDNDFFNLGDIEEGKYLIVRDGRFGIKFGSPQGVRLNNQHLFSSTFRHCAEVGVAETGTWMKGDVEPFERSEELEAFLDNQGWHIPTQRTLEQEWAKFEKSLVDCPYTKLSAAYQFAMVKAMSTGRGRSSAISAGKFAHKMASGHVLSTSKTIAFKEAPKGAPSTAKKTVAQVCVEMASKKVVPSKASWAKADPKKVKILAEKEHDGLNVVWAHVTSSQNGPKPYNTVIAYKVDGVGARHLVSGRCNCPAGEQGCYHMASVALALGHAQDA